MKRCIAALLLLLLMLNACAAGGAPSATTDSGSADEVTSSADDTPKEETVEDYLRIKEENRRYLRLGAYMWYGYSLLVRGAYTNKLLDEYLEYYEPEWGYGYNEIEHMEYQIDLASSYGLSFFAIEYWPAGSEYVYDTISVDYFLKAKNSQKMDFCLLVANHDKDRIYYDNWKTYCEDFVRYMCADNYLKLDGKPVLVFYLPDQLVIDLGGFTKTRECFDYLRDQMKAKGYPEILILGCDAPYGSRSGRIDYNEENFSETAFKGRINSYERCGFDAFTGFNSRPLRNQDGGLEIEFTELLANHENCWEAFSTYTDSRYAPNLINGWDDRNKYPELSILSCYNINKTGEAFTEHVLNAYAWIKDNPDNALGNLAFVYAWDESDEGSFFIPTKGEGYMMLDALKAAMDTIKQNP